MGNIVIVGGGFGGVYAAKNLLNKLPQGYKVTLINNINYFLFTPLLHEVAVGALNRHSIVLPIRELLACNNFRFIRCTVSKVDFKKKKVYYGSGILDYDYLVIAVGSKTNYFNVPGAEKYSLSLKTIRDSIAIRDKVIFSLETASALKNKKEVAKYLSYVVIGAGPTGVEVAGDLCEFLRENLDYFPELKGYKPKVYLVQAEKEIITIVHEKCRLSAASVLESKGVSILTESRVTEVKEEHVVINNSNRIDAYTIIWSGGIKPNFIETIPKIQDEIGYFIIDDCLRLKGFKDVFSLGDCAYNSENRVPALAQVAVKQSEVLADNIVSAIQEKSLRKFRFKNKGVLISVGKRYAVGEIYLGKKALRAKGIFAWLMKRHIYFMNLIGFKNKVKVGLEWLLNLIFSRDFSEI